MFKDLMKKEPIFDDIYCKKECPYFERYTHPYYSVNAWCFKLMKELGYYDFFIAKCQQEEENKRRVKQVKITLDK